MFVDCREWDGDAAMKLIHLQQLVCQLILKYGKDALIRFDAGANNVSVMVMPEPKKESK